MQERHKDRHRYFNELAATSHDFYIGYLRRHIALDCHTRVLEVGCGDGGNLLPFARLGCYTLGIDQANGRIEDARRFFEEAKADGNFVHADFFKYPVPTDEAQKFDVVLLHDVIEHVPDKETFMLHIQLFLKKGGLFFAGFPAWQMPFGGHQQICRSRLCSHLPFFHLLPNPVYTAVLRACGEDRPTIGELMSIKRCKTPIELFEKTARKCGFKVTDRTLWLINPHYRQKFGLTPRLLPSPLCRIKYLRNFFTTSCFYLLSPDNDAFDSRKRALWHP